MESRTAINHILTKNLNQKLLNFHAYIGESPRTFQFTNKFLIKTLLAPTQLLKLLQIDPHYL